MPKTIADYNKANNNIPLALVYKVAKGNNTGTTTSANAPHASSNARLHRSAVISKTSSNTSNQNSTTTSANAAHASSNALSHRTAASVTKSATAGSNSNSK